MIIFSKWLEAPIIKFKNVEFRDLLWEPLTSITVPQVLRLRFMWMPMETPPPSLSSPPTRSLGTDITMALGSHWTSTAEDRGRDQGPRHNADKEAQRSIKLYITAGFNQTMTSLIHLLWLITFDRNTFTVLYLIGYIVFIIMFGPTSLKTESIDSRDVCMLRSHQSLFVVCWLVSLLRFWPTSNCDNSCLESSFFKFLQTSLWHLNLRRVRSCSQRSFKIWQITDPLKL